MTRNEKLAKDIQKFLVENDLHEDTRIYYDGLTISNGEEILEGLDPIDFFEYAKTESVCMSFEGALNFLLNHSGDFKLIDKFNKIFMKHNAWYERGFSWSLTVYWNEDYS